jgi:hypothetical protein
MLWVKRITVLLLLLTGCMLSVPSAGTTSASLQEPAGLSLKLSAEATTVRVMEQPKVNIVITNGGREPVALVRPGDGSDRELRTPLVKWLVEPVPGEGDPAGILRAVMDCGNINALRPGEVFTLGPGESESFRTHVWATFSKPGKYRVRYEYEDRPSMEWGGIVLGAHDEGAMRRVRESTACKLTSGEVIFTVIE